MFGGKGGVGKTSLAAACALYVAGERPDAKVLIVSTDPAHSLSDSFAQPIGDRVTPIEGSPNLWGWELDAQRIYRDFMDQYRGVLTNIVDRGTYFDKEDVAEFLALALPGQDEMMALRALAKTVRSNEYTLIVVDTAPTGHTLRLLSLPQTLAKWLHVLQLMHQKHRYIVSRLAGRYRKGEVDAFLEEMRGDLKAIASILTDRKATKFVPVCIPEAMSIEETQRLLEGLSAFRVPVKTIVINRVATNDGCPFCQARTQGQKESLEEIQEKLCSYKALLSPAAVGVSPQNVPHHLVADVSLDLVRVPLLAEEVRGASSLKAFGRALLGERLPSPLFSRSGRNGHSGNGRSAALPERELLLFGGKGGVGKTTMATAVALHAATSNPTRKLLLFSIDPAHSISDSLGIPIGDKVTAVPGIEGLFALEMDALRLLEEFKEKYIKELDAVWDAFFRSSGARIVFDREITEELIEATPPGVDELMALMKIMDFISEGRFDRYILDMAPTGHALRFLETPDLIRDWFQVFFKVLLKHRPMMGRKLDHVAELLVGKSKQLRLAKGLLTDARRCQFVPVAIPEAMSVQETRRLVQRLEGLSIESRPLIVNMVVPPIDCGFCGTKRYEQQQYIEELAALHLGCITVPLLPDQVVGREGLLDVGRAIFADGHETTSEESGDQAVLETTRR